MTLCFFWKLTQHPQATVNTDRGTSDKYSKQIRMVGPDLKTVQT